MTQRKYSPPIPSPEQDPIFSRIINIDYLRRRRVFRQQMQPPYPRFFYRHTSLDPENIVSVDRLRDVVVRSELWLSSPEDFNDPFDTKVKLELNGSDEERLSILKSLEERLPHLSEPQRSELRSKYLLDRSLFEKTLLNAVRSNLSTIGVACFIPSARNLLMWGHYSDGHKGIVLQFEPTRNLDIFTFPVPVNYGEKYPVLDWINDRENGLRSAMLSKYSEWSYENEFRIVHPGGARSYMPFNPAGLTGIFIGCRASEDTITKVKNIVLERKEYGLPGVRLMKAHLHSNNYRLVFKRL